MQQTFSSWRLVQVACGLGLIHAGFSLYWALGGSWLLDTVGQWAVTLARTSPLAAFWGLLLIALLKVAAAVVPLLNAGRRLPWPRLWRTLSWIGGPLLILYGGVNTGVAWLVLSGVLGGGEIDRRGMLGHAALWDPLFLLWGLTLTGHLWLTRPRTL
ncbi:DUF3995 domain-containing protein [Deinococcus frigens]|uniref:DUF3995 domain-containing protein n=1 Tax=Deinococcus frigens TaxID=249403 RepID=UPI0004972D93|nr:DUF3995 domain-containing protein [Deinococcus frigens]